MHIYIFHSTAHISTQWLRRLIQTALSSCSLSRWSLGSGTSVVSSIYEWSQKGPWCLRLHGEEWMDSLMLAFLGRGQHIEHGALLQPFLLCPPAYLFGLLLGWEPCLGKSVHAFLHWWSHISGRSSEGHSIDRALPSSSPCYMGYHNFCHDWYRNMFMKLPMDGRHILIIWLPFSYNCSLHMN